MRPAYFCASTGVTLILPNDCLILLMPVLQREKPSHLLPESACVRLGSGSGWQGEPGSNAGSGKKLTETG